MKYKTAMKVVDYVDFSRKLNRYNHHKYRNKTGYVEVFFSVDGGRFAELVDVKKP